MTDKCSEAPVKFNVSSGIKIKGKVLPVIENVEVSLTTNSSNLTLSTKTNEKGVYSFGRYPVETTFQLTAKVKGYDLARIPNSFDFNATKLSSINITIESNQSYDESEILFALSRPDGFRKTQKSSTFITDLSPGYYFLKPILKEYKFDPPQFNVNLVSGQTIQVQMKVERYQYGISGHAKRITGEVEPDVEIKAVKSNGEHQIALTDANGYFRIGGFDSNQTIYLFASINNPIIRVTPIQTKVFLTDSEYSNVKLTTVKQPQTFDILGNVIINSELLSDITVVLMNSRGSVVNRFDFPSNSCNMFHFLKLGNDNYTISVVDTRQHGNIVCSKKVVEFHQPFVNLEIDCEAKQKKEVFVKSPVSSICIASGAVLLWLFFFSFNCFKNGIISLFTPKLKSE